MLYGKSTIFYIFSLGFLGFSTYAQVDVRTEEEKAKDAEKALFYKDPPFQPITGQEREEACRKYDKTYLSFHDNAYWVKDCKRFLLTTEETADLTKKGVRFKEAEGRVIAALPDGGAFAASQQ